MKLLKDIKNNAFSELDVLPAYPGDKTENNTRMGKHNKNNIDQELFTKLYIEIRDQVLSMVLFVPTEYNDDIRHIRF